MKRRKWKLSVILIMLFCIISMIPNQFIEAKIRETDYIFSTRARENVDAPTSYELDTVLYAKDLNVDSLAGLTSCFVKYNKIYVAAADKIIIMDEDFNVLHILSEYKSKNGEDDKITTPEGIYVTDNEDLYITEPTRGRILKFNKELECVEIFGKPEGLELDIEYSPMKVVVDNVGRMYVIAKNAYEGILELNYDGEFSRYFGVNKVTFNVADLFWRSIATEAQRAKMALWLPTEFTNMTLSPEGFLYTTSASEETLSIKLLNAKGTNVLQADEKWYPQGDFNYMLGGTSNGIGGPSTLSAIDCNEYGMFTVLDTKRNRIFTYSEDGTLLFVFGGMGDTRGSFRNPMDLKFLGDKILVVDRMAETIVLMKPTKYAKLIIEATKLHYQDRMEEAVPLWNEVAKMNPNFDYAFTGLGKAAFREGDFDSALSLFKKGDNRKYYSKAFDKVRNDFIERNFSKFFILLVIVIVIKIGFSIYKKRKYGKVQGRGVD